MTPLLRVKMVAWLALVLVLAGCTTSHYRNSADKEVYSAIQSKTPLVPNMATNFTIEQTNLVLLEGLPVVTNVPEFLGPDGERERGARKVNLGDALNLGVHSSRSYQSRKEQLYISALNLTLVRHQFAPIFSGNINAQYGGQTAQAVSFEVDAITGDLIPVYSDNLVERRLTTDSGTVGVSWLLRDIGKLTADLNATFQRFITSGGNPASALTSVNESSLTATFTRPLLRNAAYKAQEDSLIQAERQLLYDLRDFTRYRKDFSVQIATSYYGVLGFRDTARNNFLNLQSSRKNAERSRALAQEGRITQSDLGRLEQQELTAESTWINSVRTYQQALDNFKLQLGLNVGSNLVLDDQELESLQIRDPHLSVEESIQVALAARLDYLTAKDQLADAERDVGLAANFLKPQLDFSSSVTLGSNPAHIGGFQLPDVQRYSWNAGLFFDPGLDRLAERNSYRSALITRNRAARAIEQDEDDIKLQVRQSWRTLDQAKRNYEISEVGVKIAERRVEEQNLLAELGRAKAQDQVDAQNSLSDSKNQRTQAVVTHTIARLQFWDNLGILYIKDNGRWEQTQDEKAH